MDNTPKVEIDMEGAKETEAKSVGNHERGNYDSTIISDVPNLLSEQDDVDTNDNMGSKSSTVEAKSASQAISDAKTEEILSKGSTSITDVKVSTKEDSSDANELTSSVINEEPILHRMIHTKILEKDNPFLEDNNNQKKRENSNTISKSFTMASEKSNNIKNPNGEYLEREKQETISDGSDIDVNQDNVNDFDITKDENQLLSFQKGSTSNNNKINNIGFDNVQQQTDSNKKSPKLGNKIVISEATKVSEGQGRTFVAYTIVNGTHSVKRRYSDFESLRNLLMKLFPMVLIPPIPEKQSLKNYSKAITNSGTNYLLSSDIAGSLESSLTRINTSTANSDEKFIRHRIKMLTKFLNHLLNDQEIMNTSIISEFLNPNTPNWNDFITNSPTFSNLPKNVLQCNPLDPTNTTRIHASLPIPTATTQIQYPKAKTNKKKQRQKDKEDDTTQEAAETKSNDTKADIPAQPNMANSFSVIERDYKLYESITNNEYKYNKRIIKNISDMKTDYKDVSTELLQFSNRELQQLDLAEQFLYLSSTYDESSTVAGTLVTSFNNNLLEQLSENVHMAGSVRELIKFQKLKFVQKEMLRKALKSKKNQLTKLQTEKNDFSPVDKIIDQEMAKSHQISFKRPEPEQQVEQSYSGMFFKGFNKIATIVKDSVITQDIDPDVLMESLQKEIKELEETLVVAEHDLDIISKEIKEKQLVRFSEIRQEEMSSIMKNCARFLKEYAEKNLKIWQDLKKTQENDFEAKS